MAFSERSLDDYVDVAQRIADFREQYPHGSLQPADPAMPYHVVRVPAGWCRRCIGRQVVKDGQAWKQCGRCGGTGVRGSGEPTEDVFIVYYAAAYREPDDPRPGIGAAWESFPGQTPYTAGSELMNAETSAWGRAIIAVLASDSKAGVASRQEVKARRAEREDGLPVNRDGSLSRSQTTDPEKDAAGVMTSAQQAEHTALQPKAAELRAVERIQPHDEGTSYCTSIPGECPLHPAAGRDPWLDQPAGHVDVPTEDKPGSIGPGQRRQIMAKFGTLDRQERLGHIIAIVGRDVNSTNELSFLEAKQVLAVIGEAVAK